MKQEQDEVRYIERPIYLKYKIEQRDGEATESPET